MSLGHRNLKDEFLTGEFLNSGRDIIVELGVLGGPQVAYVRCVLSCVLLFVAPWAVAS